MNAKKPESFLATLPGCPEAIVKGEIQIRYANYVLSPSQIILGLLHA